MVAALSKDYRSAGLSAQDAAMLGYVDKLTRTPVRMSTAEVEELRCVGFDDTAILDICQVAAYYAFVNRLANGLGVELEASVD